MKKLCAMLLIFAVAFTVSACGRNSNYYKLDKQTVYTYVDQPISIDPFQLLQDNYSALGIQLSDTALSNLADYYDVTVEYANENKGIFKDLTLKDNNIYEANPKPTAEQEKDTLLFTNNTYDFKIHFINKETKSEKDMINLYATYAFLPALNSKATSVTSALNSDYTLLDNISSINADGKDMTKAEIEAKYDIVYTVTLGSDDLSSTVNDGVITLSSSGTYNVTIKFTEIPATDGGSSASESSTPAPTPIEITIVYTIVVQ